MLYAIPCYNSEAAVGARSNQYHDETMARLHVVNDELAKCRGWPRIVSRIEVAGAQGTDGGHLAHVLASIELSSAKDRAPAASRDDRLAVLRANKSYFKRA